MSESPDNKTEPTEQSPEKEISIPRVRFEFDYKNIYGQIFASHKLDTWTLPARPRFAADIIDGYIETDFGSFAIEKPVEVATKAIADIKEFCRLSLDLENFKKERAEAESQHQISISRFQRLNDTDSWRKTDGRINTLRQQIFVAEYALGEIKPKIEEYRV